ITTSTLTTTTLMSSANPSVAGQSVVYTATVSPAGSGTAIPTGTVTFLDGSTTLASNVALNSAGQAGFFAENLTLGTHSITAVYSGNGSFAPSTSTALIQVVGRASTSISATPILATFEGSRAAGPDSPLVVDSDGNLFGVTESDFINFNGTAFEIAK